MILDQITVRAEAAVRRYEQLCDGWRMAFNNALNRSDVTAVSEADRLVREGYTVSQSFLETERSKIYDAVWEVAQIAHDATAKQISSASAQTLSDAAREHLRVTESYIVDELIAQIHRDIALLRQSYQRVALEVGLAARSRRISPRTAMIEYRIGNQAELQFTFHDRATRKWNSSKFVRAMFRQALLAVYNETVMLVLADHGLQRARVHHVDPNAEVHGMVIALSANTEFPTYSEIRNAAFHPNANAFLEPEVDLNVSS